MADFNKYYALQSQGLSGFHGPSFQKGHGLGSMFKRLFRWVIPIIKQNAAPLLNTQKKEKSEKNPPIIATKHFR